MAARMQASRQQQQQQLGVMEEPLWVMKEQQTIWVMREVKNVLV